MQPATRGRAGCFGFIPGEGGEVWWWPPFCSCWLSGGEGCVRFKWRAGWVSAGLGDSLKRSCRPCPTERRVRDISEGNVVIVCDLASCNKAQTCCVIRWTKMWPEDVTLDCLVRIMLVNLAEIRIHRLALLLPLWGPDLWLKEKWCSDDQLFPAWKNILSVDVEAGRRPPWWWSVCLKAVWRTMCVLLTINLIQVLIFALQWYWDNNFVCV